MDKVTVTQADRDLLQSLSVQAFGRYGDRDRLLQTVATYRIEATRQALEATNG